MITLSIDLVVWYDGCGETRECEEDGGRQGSAALVPAAP